ncbi:MAG: peptidylprolyl isomerase [Chitinophagaceae bacterium]
MLYLKTSLLLICLLAAGFFAKCQKKTITQIKTDIENSGNSPLYVKDVLKKKFVLDTVPVARTNHFRGLSDSLAFHGKVGKVYGPFNNGKILIQVLAKLPNKFNHVGQIFLDTAVFSRKIADSMANSIIAKIKDGSSTFERMAKVYSMGGEAATEGELGWIATGAIVPAIEAELDRHKKGEIFKVWTNAGVHIIRKTDDPKQMDGFALMMRIFL